MKASYDSISQSYTDLVKTDPVKQFVQYPSALRLLGDISQKTVLDVGCGSGLFDQELAHRGAMVTGYDVSAEQIANAQKVEKNDSLGIQYVVADPSEFEATEKFDKAVSVLVLHYARDKEHLAQFFASTCQALRDDGKFVCILVNPNFKRLGQILYNRRFTRLASGKMQVDFLDKDQQISCSAEYSDFSTTDYEQTAIDGGFQGVEWIRLKVEEAGLQKLGQDYWQGFEEDCLYVGFIAHK
ncbi:MAG: methyltransferase domain-containing protein [Candidatus Moranbacteria bacterium]|nr:methyltransferase domain-containing protein [Candidatus Moranbacteria bacterium]